jgi:hypothetical protein
MTTIKIDESTTSAAGGVTVTIRAEPLTLDIPDDIAAAPAAAIAQGIANDIRSITQMSRDGKHRMFNRTGKLAAELAAIAGAGGYDIVAPAGYLQDDALFEQLVALVPAIRDPTTLAELEAAIEKTMTDMVTVG